MKSIAPVLLRSGLFLIGLDAAVAEGAGDAGRGKVFFQQSCALCHATVLGAGNRPVSGQGPSLVGVVGRAAASVGNFNYSAALRAAGVEVRPNPEATAGHGAYVDDPFGNRIELIAQD